jgi:transglutaminase-like putative cysteine protease
MTTTVTITPRQSGETPPEVPGISATPPERPVPAKRTGLAVPPGAYPQLVLLGVAVATTSLVYLRYFGDRTFLVGTLAAAAAGVLVTALVVPRRWPAAVSFALAVLGFVLVGVFAVFRSTLDHGVPTLGTLGQFGGIVLGWARMLSTNLPADPVGALVVVPALVTWLAATVSTVIVLRTRTVLAPALAPAVAFGIGLVFTSDRPLDNVVLVAVLLVELLLLALLRAGAADPLSRSAGLRASVGRLLFGLPVVLVVAAAGVAGAHYVPVATGQDRFDLRDVVPVNLDIGDSISPLVTLKAQLRAPAQDLFTVRIGGADAGIDRIRTVALDQYDGALWSSRDEFLLAGHTLPPNADIVDPGQVSLRVTISGLAGPYLPEVGLPVTVAATRIGYSPDSGTLATDAPSVAGMSYQLTADVPRRDGLADAVPSVAGAAAHDTDLPPGLPTEMQAKGRELAGAVAKPYAKLLAIQDYLRRLPYSLSTRPGHSYDALRRLFDSNPADQAGYAEQFAAAFAVLARSQGFPTRVAVGYLLNPAHRHGDTYTVTSHDAHAWPEVNLAGYGWVAFEPTDPQHHAAVPTPKQQQTTASSGNDPAAAGKGSTPTEDPSLPTVAAPGITVLDWALWVLIGLGVLVVLIPVAVTGEKIRRRRRRRSGSRAARIIGAWEDTVDRLVENGLPVTGSSTATEVAWQAHERLGARAAAVAVLAPLVVTAAYSPIEPDESAVGQAWQLNARVRRELRGTRRPLRRITGWLDPRPLFARRRDDRRRRRVLDALTRG